jgi:hypothetical protein
LSQLTTAKKIVPCPCTSIWQLRTSKALSI